MRRSYKYRIYLNKNQREALVNSLYFCKNLYNAALEERISFYKRYTKSKSYVDQANQLPELKRLFEKETENIHSQSLQFVLKTLDSSFKSFFRRIKSGETPGFPRFKSIDRFKSICFPQCDLKTGGAKLLPNGRLNIRGIPGDIKINMHRPFEGRCKTIQIKKEGDLFFIILSCEGVLEKLLPKTGKTIGIDLGITSFITTDDGTKFHHPKPWKTSKEKLAYQQKKLAAKQRGSSNRAKAKSLLQRTYNKIANQRSDWQHKVANQLVKDNDVIVVENLNVKGMLEAKGFEVSKGNIADASWSNFVALLTYKAESAGRILIKVNPKNTSKTCSCCGNINKFLTLRDRVYNCDACGIAIDRDINAAINIRRLGTSLAISGEVNSPDTFRSLAL